MVSAFFLSSWGKLGTECGVAAGLRGTKVPFLVGRHPRKLEKRLLAAVSGLQRAGENQVSTLIHHVGTGLLPACRTAATPCLALAQNRYHLPPRMCSSDDEIETTIWANLGGCIQCSHLLDTDRRARHHLTLGISSLAVVFWIRLPGVATVSLSLPRESTVAATGETSLAMSISTRRRWWSPLSRRYRS